MAIVGSDFVWLKKGFDACNALSGLWQTLKFLSTNEKLFSASRHMLEFVAYKGEKKKKKRQKKGRTSDYVEAAKSS